jgi:hypothetical protein
MDLVNAINEVNARLAELDTLTVVQNGPYSWTRGELAALFTRVEPKENWKLPIDTEVVLAGDRELFGLKAAIEFFTGSAPALAPVHPLADGQTRYHVAAAGYYAAIGA